MAGPRGDAYELRTARPVRPARLIRTLGWASALASLAAGHAGQPLLTLLAVAVAVGTTIATIDMPGHSRLAEAVQATVLIVAVYLAFGPPLAFLYT